MPTDFPEKPRNVVHIVTKDFPQYFALVSRPRQDVATVGPEGSILVSSRIPKAQVYHKPKWVLNVVFLWWNPHNFFSLSCNFVSFKLSYFKTSMYFELFLAFALPLYFYHEIYVAGVKRMPILDACFFWHCKIPTNCALVWFLHSTMVMSKKLWAIYFLPPISPKKAEKIVLLPQILNSSVATNVNIIDADQTRRHCLNRTLCEA